MKKIFILIFVLLTSFVNTAQADQSASIIQRYKAEHKQALDALVSATIQGANREAISDKLIEIVKYETFLAGRGVYSDPNFIGALVMKSQGLSDVRSVGYAVLKQEIQSNFNLNLTPELLLKNLEYSQPYRTVNED